MCCDIIYHVLYDDDYEIDFSRCMCMLLLMQLKGSIIAMKAKLRGLCIHDAIHSSSDLCPKVVSDKVGYCVISIYLYH